MAFNQPSDESLEIPVVELTLLAVASNVYLALVLYSYCRSGTPVNIL